jgi:branched-chain amino acid transport system permease protein
LLGASKRIVWSVVALGGAALIAMLAAISWPDWLNDLLISKKAFFSALFNGTTVAGLYFVVAAGFTLIFGLMRNVNLAHGSLYLLGAYLGYEIAHRTGNWLLGAVGAFVIVGLVGAVFQVVVFRRLEGKDLQQTLVTIGISIVAADLMLWIWGGQTFQIQVPDLISGVISLPIVSAVRSNGDVVYLTYPLYRVFVLAVAIAVGTGLWFMLARTRLGMMVRAGVDDRQMLSATGIRVQAVFIGVFALGAGLAGLAGMIGGSALSVSPGEDLRYLLASLVVVIVGGMGSIAGAAIGALLVGLTEQIGLVYFPTYSTVLTFVIMVVTLAIRPQGLMGRS